MTTDLDAGRSRSGTGSGIALLIAILAALAGAALDGVTGFYVGGLLGFGAALLWQQRQTLATLQTRIDALESRGVSGPAPEPEPAAASDASPAPTAATEPAPVSAPAPADATASDARRPSEAAIPPAPESELDRMLRAAIATIWRFFTTGNLVVRVGVVVLFFGVAFLLRFAYENALLPIELRLAGSALGGIVLTAAGWRLRHRVDTYGLVLQGAGVGLLYLTIFAAARLYTLLPTGAAFAALVALVAASSLLAVVQRSQALALFATSGGFLAPVLMSTGAGSHVALFSYYALLNAGILAMAWFRAWRWLNWAGFIFTFVIGALWGRDYYRPELFATTEPFLLLFFAYYVGVSLLFARRQSPDLKGLVDGTLVFGTPTVAFALQWAMVRDMPFGMAYSALGAGLVYGILAVWLKRRGAFGTLLGESFLALAVTFATLAIPFAFDDQRWTGAMWALEGAGLLWVGLRQRQLLPRVAGMGLQVAAAAAYAADWRHRDATPFLNGDFLGAVLLGIAGVFSAWLLYRHRSRLYRPERWASWGFLYWGAIWWSVAGLREIERLTATGGERFRADNLQEHAAVLFAALTATLLTLLARRLRWPAALQPGLLLLPALTLALPNLDLGWQTASPLADYGWIAWPAAFAALYWHLAARDDAARTEGTGLPTVQALWHAGSWWLLAGFGAWVVAALAATLDLGPAWQTLPWGAIPLAAIAQLHHTAGSPPQRWPFTASPDSYFGWGLDTGLAVLLGWVLITGLAPADPAPLPYLVLANPLELVQLGVLLVAFRRALRAPWSAAARLGLGLAAFVWLNLCAARAVHYYAGIDYPVERIILSDAFQTTASILWTSTALLLMGLGARRRQRPLWGTGALLLAAVIVKLFSVDLSSLGMVARIVSFISVGIIMLVIGYFAPLPPARPEANTEQST